MLGREVNVIAKGIHSAVEHSYRLNAAGLASGVCISTQTNSGVLVKK